MRRRRWVSCTVSDTKGSRPWSTTCRCWMSSYRSGKASQAPASSASVTIMASIRAAARASCIAFAEGLQLRACGVAQHHHHVHVAAAGLILPAHDAAVYEHADELVAEGGHEPCEPGVKLGLHRGGRASRQAMGDIGQILLRGPESHGGVVAKTLEPPHGTSRGRAASQVGATPRRGHAAAYGEAGVEHGEVAQGPWARAGVWAAARAMARASAAAARRALRGRVARAPRATARSRSSRGRGGATGAGRRRRVCRRASVARGRRRAAGRVGGHEAAREVVLLGLEPRVEDGRLRGAGRLHRGPWCCAGGQGGEAIELGQHGAGVVEVAVAFEEQGGGGATGAGRGGEGKHGLGHGVSVGVEVEAVFPHAARHVEHGDAVQGGSARGPRRGSTPALTALAYRLPTSSSRGHPVASAISCRKVPSSISWASSGQRENPARRFRGAAACRRGRVAGCRRCGPRRPRRRGSWGSSVRWPTSWEPARTKAMCSLTAGARSARASPASRDTRGGVEAPGAAEGELHPVGHDGPQRGQGVGLAPEPRVAGGLGDHLDEADAGGVVQERGGQLAPKADAHPAREARRHRAASSRMRRGDVQLTIGATSSARTKPTKRPHPSAAHVAPPRARTYPAA
jgi:hypothetical protein